MIGSEAYLAAMRRYLRFDEWERTVAATASREAAVSKLGDLLRECVTVIRDAPAHPVATR